MVRAPHLRVRFLAGLVAMLAAVTSGRGEQFVSFDSAWRFHPGDLPGAETPTFYDAGWRSLDLPHDWSIEGTPVADAPTAGGGGFFPAGIGWYRKTFVASPAWAGHVVWLEFEGVSRASEVWLNGRSLGRRPNGWAGFRYDVTAVLRPGAENVIAVRVDNSAQPSSRYYTGSGLTGHVRLRVAGLLHVAPDSLVVTTLSLTAEAAKVSLTASVASGEAAAAMPTGAVEATVIDANGNVVAAGRQEFGPAYVESATARFGAAGADGSLPLYLELTVPQPRAWSPELPALYTARLRIRVGDRVVEETQTRFGIRTVRVSAERGFELNGRSVKLFGGNVHDDNGPLGVAAFDRAAERKVALLKAAGFNAVRTAHNPPAPAFLDACDRLGLLVLDEAFDGWKKAKVAADYSRDFDAWARRDVAALVRRDRNRPSVVLWSVGNEPYERASASGVRIAAMLASTVRTLDPSRPVTAGINGPGSKHSWTILDPLFNAFDVAGYNYELARADDDHVRVPARVILGTESYLRDAFASWAAVHDRPFVIGDFVWSALDYLGEAGIGRVFPPGEPVVPHWEGSHFPWHGATCGDIDLIGERRPLSHYRAIVWDRGERLFGAVQVPTADGRPWNLSLWAAPPLRVSWNWPDAEGRTVQVEAYSRHDAVRVYVNDTLVGEKPTTRAEEYQAVFSVPYAPGELRLVGIDAGRETETFTLHTAGSPAALQLRADRAMVVTDGQDLAFVTVTVVDAAGRRVPSANDRVQYTVTGPAELFGIANADLASLENYRANPHALNEGRALVILRPHAGSGDIVLTATAPGLPPATLRLPTRQP